MELDLDITDISIRPLREEDSFLCFLAKTNPDSLKYLESVSPPFSSVSESTSWILSKLTSQNDIVLAITYRDLFIGHIGLYSLYGRQPEIGILLGFTQFWGHGIASHIIPIFLEHISNLNLRTIYIRVKEFNHAALSVYRK